MSENENNQNGEPEDQQYHGDPEGQQYHGDPEDQQYHDDPEDQQYHGDPEEVHYPLTDTEDEYEDLSGSEGSDAEPAVEKKQVRFSKHYQPIGPGSVQYSTYVGNMARTHCRPTYVNWTAVPPESKKHVWRTVSAAYELDYSLRFYVMRKANVAWKNWKFRLRLSYDKYSTDVERITNVPNGVKKEDWEEFVQICSTEEEQIKRANGKLARTKMKLPHTSGRRGSARTLEELEKQSPDGKVTRTQLFVAIHTRKDGTCPFPDARPTLDEITRLVTRKPYLAHRDLDNDPVALKCHRDGKGRVLGHGDNVTRTAIKVAAPYLEIAECERKRRKDTDTDFRLVMQRLDEETKARKILEEKLAHLANLSTSHNQVGQSSTTPAETNASPQSTRCIVKSFRNKALALGSVRTDVTAENDTYQIRIVDIFDHSAELYEGGTFEDVRIGSTIVWPKHSVEQI